jgi:hypothetical protein
MWPKPIYQAAGAPNHAYVPHDYAVSWISYGKGGFFCTWATTCFLTPLANSSGGTQFILGDLMPMGHTQR